MESQPLSSAAPRRLGIRLRGLVTSWLVGPWLKADSSQRWFAVAHVGLIVVAAVMRVWDLGARAMHHDESLHAYYSYNLFSGVGYEHHPMMHGPFQMEATAAIFFALGDSDFTARLLYALAGAALVGMPFLFRRRLGGLGAVFVSAMLAFSPAMLYFSRFARNDILMAVWTLGLVICMWGYMDQGKNRYLYIGAALLALAFATKETAYIVTVTLGLFLALLVAARNWPAIRRDVAIGEDSPPVAVMRLLGGALSATLRGLRMSGLSRPASFLVLLFTLSLPMGSALFSLLQDTPLLSWSGLVLAQPIGSGNIGAPLRGGLVIAFLVIASLVGLSAYFGLRWKRGVWWLCAAIFYAIIVLFYSTFFTNLDGVGSGMWRSLGYWLAQQDVARGAQPWYYYFVITPIYEFLPLLLSVVGAVYYLRRRDGFGLFLVFWVATTFILYMAASEKMPWLLVNIALPMIVLSGKFLGDVFMAVQWRRLWTDGGLLVVIGVPVLLMLSWRLAFFGLEGMDGRDFAVLAVSLVLLAASAVAGLLLARRLGYANFGAFALVSITVVLLVLSIRTGWYAAYRNGDTPVEMIVYTQTSPDVVRTLRNMERLGEAQGDRKGVPVTVDQTSGFTWPWAWYLRDFTSLSYGAYEDKPLDKVPEASVLVIHEKNRNSIAGLLTAHYDHEERIKHRWWFPEGYKGLTVKDVLTAVVDRKDWRKYMDYFLYRKLTTPLGSEDAYAYFTPAPSL